MMIVNIITLTSISGRFIFTKLR
uniref:Uncharacterized protein n=1 Tax=Tetranychus urticae TaxID=32264 RepID=T1JTF0_TETUR